MASCSTPDLMADAKCFFALAGAGQFQAVKLALLCRILQAIDPMATCDVTSLMASAKCFFPVVSAGMGQALELQLLCNIAAGGAGPGSPAQVRSGHGAPDSAGGTLPIIYFNLDCTEIWYWNPLTLTWTDQNLGKATGQYVVPTVVELRQIATVTCPPLWARTYGNVVAFGGQGSEYGWDPDSLEADDGMSVIKSDDHADADPGRWLQLTSS